MSVTVEMVLLVGGNVTALAFAAGGVWVRLRALERKIDNGISSTLRKHGVALAAIEERCEGREAWIRRIEKVAEAK